MTFDEWWRKQSVSFEADEGNEALAAVSAWNAALEEACNRCSEWSMSLRENIKDGEPYGDYEQGMRYMVGTLEESIRALKEGK